MGILWNDAGNGECDKSHNKVKLSLKKVARCFWDSEKLSSNTKKCCKFLQNPQDSYRFWNKGRGKSQQWI